MKCQFARHAVLRSSRATGARALSHGVAGRARSRTLVPGGALNAPHAGHRAASSVVRKSSSAALSLQRARSTSHPVRESRLQFSGTGWVTVLARCPGRETRRCAPWFTSECCRTRSTMRREHGTCRYPARSVVADCFALTCRPHGAGFDWRESASSRACDSTLARWRRRSRDSREEGADRLRVWRVSRSGYDARACASVLRSLPRQTRRLSGAQCQFGRTVTPSFQLPALRLRCTAGPRTAPRPLLFRYAPFRSLKHRRHADG